MSTFYTADLHIGHKRITELAHRPFGSVEEMNEAIVQRWNATVSGDDTVWVLGDAAMGPIKDSLAVCASLRGRKILVAGNHDRCWPDYYGNQEKCETWAARYKDEGGFTDIVIGNGRADFPDLTVPVDISHFPYTEPLYGGQPDRYAAHRPADKGGWLVHGHVHDAWKVRGRQINCGVDVWDFTPVPAETLAELIRMSR